MVNERPGIGSGYVIHTWQRTHQDSGRVLYRDVSAGEYKRADFGGLKGKPFELAITNAFVSGEDYPAVLPRQGKPEFVGGTSVEMLGKAFDQRAGIAQRRYDRRTVERLIEKKGERLRRP